MAKFYQRYVVPGVDQTVLYGYSDDNLIVNGQFYTASTGLQQVGNFQCFPVIADCACQIAPVHAVSVFEPGLYANHFDLAGGRFSQEYETNTYQTYGTYKDPTNRWTFKNQTHAVAASCWCTTASTGGAACLRGCVLSGSNQAAIYTCCCATAALVGVSVYHAMPVITQCDTYRCFVPITAGQTSIIACQCCTCYAMSLRTSHTEPTFGDATGTYQLTSSATVCCPCASSTNCSNPVGIYAMAFTNCCCNPTGQYNASCLSDTILFGSCCQCFVCTQCGTSSVIRAVVYGAYPLYNQTSGAIEHGIRSHLVSNETYVYYLYFNSQVGGIQGTDTATSLSERMQLRVLNTSTSATTTLATWKKGVSGLVIPSNPDLSNETSYRFYMITFNGADTVTQTISIYRPTLNLSLGTATIGSAYALTMTAGEQQAIYAALGHNNTGDSKINNSNFRRQTTNRIWFSTDGDGNKRLHLGIYNTNGTGLVTNANTFNDPDQRGSMFKIWSWGLNDGTTTATFLGSVDLPTYAPRYFCPLNDDWTVVYAGASLTNDIVLTLNGTTGLYQYQNTMPYSASRLFKDADGRWAVQVEDPAAGNDTFNGNYIDIITSSVGQTLVITATTTSYIYSGTTINGNITVNVYNYLGERVAKTVNLTVVGPTASPGITFANDEYTTTVTTSALVDTTVAIKVISSASAKIIGTVSES
jgi:hypothetical protein